MGLRHLLTVLSLLAGVLGPRLAGAEWQATSRLSHDGPISAAPVPPGE